MDHFGIWLFLNPFTHNSNLPICDRKHCGERRQAGHQHRLSFTKDTISWLKTSSFLQDVLIYSCKRNTFFFIFNLSIEVFLILKHYKPHPVLNEGLSHPLKPFPKKSWFLRVCMTILLKTLWEKEKLLLMSDFSFSHSVFYSFVEFSAIFIKLKTVFCKTLSVWMSLKFVIWERVKALQATL